MTTAINTTTNTRLMGGLLSSVGAHTRAQVVILQPYTDADRVSSPVRERNMHG
jgi:hypothetical protein